MDHQPGHGYPEPFGPESLIWDGAGDRRMLLVLGGALIMQTMHPAIGAAVAKTGTYRTDPWGRLERSLTSLQKWVYAGPAAIEEGERLRKFHTQFTGVDHHGRPYSALDPGPWAWVHLTAYERAVTMTRHFVRPAPAPEQEQTMYREIMQLGRILQVPEEMLPATVEDYWTYFDEMVSTTLEAHPTALEVLARMERTPPPKWFPRSMRALWRPLGMSAGRFQHFVTVGTFPPSIRKVLGLEWSHDDERKLRRIGRVVATTFPRLPERLRYMPIAYRARKAARGVGAG